MHGDHSNVKLFVAQLISALAFISSISSLMSCQYVIHTFGENDEPLGFGYLAKEMNGEDKTCSQYNTVYHKELYDTPFQFGMMSTSISSSIGGVSVIFFIFSWCIRFPKSYFKGIALVFLVNAVLISFSLAMFETKLCKFYWCSKSKHRNLLKFSLSIDDSLEEMVLEEGSEKMTFIFNNYTSNDQGINCEESSCKLGWGGFFAFSGIFLWVTASILSFSLCPTPIVPLTVQDRKEIERLNLNFGSKQVESRKHEKAVPNTNLQENEIFGKLPSLSIDSVIHCHKDKGRNINHCKNKDRRDIDGISEDVDRLFSSV